MGQFHDFKRKSKTRDNAFHEGDILKIWEIKHVPSCYTPGRGIVNFWASVCSTKRIWGIFVNVLPLWTPSGKLQLSSGQTLVNF